jgi:hypothetical protein
MIIDSDTDAVCLAMTEPPPEFAAKPVIAGGALLLCLLLASALRAQPRPSVQPGPPQQGRPPMEIALKLSRTQASLFANLALKGISGEHWLVSFAVYLLSEP